MSRKNTLLLGTMLLAFSSAGLAAAAPDDERPGRGPGRLIERMDADGDGAIGRAEFREAWEKRMERRFDRLDADGDGSITEEEVREARKKRKRRRAEARPAED